MGGFVDYKCDSCQYAETDIGVGRGRDAFPYLSLFSCGSCKCVGSTWIYESKPPMCMVCYHKGVTLLPDDTRDVICPRCGGNARFTPKEGGWE